MKRKILSLALLVTMLFWSLLMLTGCGNSENGNDGASSNDNNDGFIADVDYDGELVKGAEYVYGQYTYKYNQRCVGRENGTFEWEDFDFSENGWSVIVTDVDSTDKIDSKILKSIGGKPIVSTHCMFYKSKASEIDISNFDSSNVVDMSHMFYHCYSPTIKGLEKLDTSNVTNMMYMFCSCSAKELDVSNFDTSNVTNFTSAFSWTSVSSLDLSNFNTSKADHFKSMFNEMRKLEEIDISSFDFSSADENQMYSMFAGGAIKKIYVKDEETKAFLEKVEAKENKNHLTVIGDAEIIVK